MLRLQYGGYTHDAGECAVQRKVQPTFSRSRQIVGFVERWDISGQIIDAGGPTAIATKLAAIDAAYAIQGQNLSLIDSASNVILSLPSSTSISGTHVIKPSLPDGAGAEWASGLKYQLTVEAEYATATASTIIVLQETMAASGGGPVYAWRRPIGQVPIRQQVSNYSPYQLVQSGYAIARGLFPTAPAPLFPGALWQGPQIRRTGPELQTGQNAPLNYRTEWNYIMQSTGPLASTPATSL